VAAVHLHLFGAVEVSRTSEGRENVLLIAPKPLALLAYLAVAGAEGHAVRRDTLLALFWPELPDSGARSALRQAVFQLRRAIGRDAILADRSSVALATDIVSSDVAAFQRLIASGERAAAVELRRGELLEGFFFSGMSIELEEWIQHEREQLRRAAIDACWGLCADAERATNGIDAALWARRAVALAPDDEVAVRRLIGILDRFGDRAGALRTAEDFRRRLEQEFDAKWSPETASLVAAVRAHAAIPTPPSVPANLVNAAVQPAEQFTHRSRGRDQGSTRKSHRQLRRIVTTSAAVAAVAAVVVMLTVIPGRLRNRAETALNSDSTKVDPSSPITIRSPVARRLYREGLGRYCAGDVPEAIRLLDAALAEDSTCAMCAYYASRIEGETGDTAAFRMLRLAARLADSAPPPERLLIHYSSLDAANSPARLAVADTLSALYPHWLEAQLAAGDAHLLADQYIPAIGFLRRVLANTSSHDSASGPCPYEDAESRLVRAYEYADSVGAAVRTAREWTKRQPRSRESWHELSEALARFGRYDDARAALDSSTRYSADASGDAMARAQIEIRAGNFPIADAMLNTVAQTGSAQNRLDALWMLVISLRAQGRLHEALAVARGPMRRAEILAQLSGAAEVAEAQVLFELGDYRRSAEVFAANPSQGREHNGRFARQHAWMLTQAASALSAAGDSADVARLADTVEVWGSRSALDRDHHLADYVRGLLWIARQQPESAVAAFRRSLAFSRTDGFSRLNYALARELLSLSRPAEAIPLLRLALQGPIEGGNYYVTRTEVVDLLAKAYDGAHRPDSAEVFYRQVERAWRAADPQFRSRLARIRARLAADGRRTVALR